MFDKLEGLIQAIEEEWKTPSPSHNNLARLLVMAFQELKTLITATSLQTANIVQNTPETAGNLSQSAEINVNGVVQIEPSNG